MRKKLMMVLAAILAILCCITACSGKIETLEDYEKKSKVLKEAKEDFDQIHAGIATVDYVARENRLTIRVTYADETLAGYSDYEIVNKIKRLETISEPEVKVLLEDMRETIGIPEITVRYVALKSDGLTLYEKIYE